MKDQHFYDADSLKKYNLDKNDQKYKTNVELNTPILD